MMEFTRRTLMIGLSSLAAAPLRANELWPNRPVILVHGFPAGGPVDTVSRIFSDELSKRIGQQLIVEPRPGAAGTTASAQVARAAPDGYTLSAIGATYAATAAMYRKLSYRPVDDFTMIGMIADFPMTFVTHSEYPMRSVRDLIERARSRTTPLTFGSPGVGSTQHLLGELFARKANIRLQHVPYRGGAPAVADLLGKQIDLIIDPPVAPLPHIRSGTLRALAVSSAGRFFLLPDVPTLAESGFPDVDITGWVGLVGPAGLPAPIIDRLNTEMARVLTEPHVIERLHASGSEARPTKPAEFKARVAADVARWTSVVGAAKIERI